MADVVAIMILAVTVEDLDKKLSTPAMKPLERSAISPNCTSL
jgi:hypothetical protein